MDFAHKGLRALFEQHDARWLNAGQVPRIERILSDLDAAESPHDMHLPGYLPDAVYGAYECPATGASCSVSSLARR